MSFYGRSTVKLASCIPKELSDRAIDVDYVEGGIPLDRIMLFQTHFVLFHHYRTKGGSSLLKMMLVCVGEISSGKIVESFSKMVIEGKVRSGSGSSHLHGIFY